MSTEARTHMDENERIAAKYVDFFRRAREARRKGEPMPPFDPPAKPKRKTKAEREREALIKRAPNVIDAAERFRRR